MADVQAGSVEPKSRVWRACLQCRKKKSKCDGKERCHACRVHSRQCQYPESNDNASTSRQSMSNLDQRFQRLDLLCQRVDDLASKLSRSLILIDQYQPLPRPESTLHEEPAEILPATELPASDERMDVETVSDSGSDSDSECRGDETPESHYDYLAQDSYGQLRYVGGQTNKILVETVQELASGTSALKNASLLPTTPGSAACSANSDCSLPFFNHGFTWPKLSYLPKPEDLLRPPRYISDLLVNVYFDQIHYTFPILFRPHFMRQYQAFVMDKTAIGSHAGFMSVFFAVCACASSLLSQDSGQQMFRGLEYYEKSLLLHYTCTGQGNIEQVQCLGLLALCSAGWNTLTQSWKLAGQAVRAAQDLGLHVDLRQGSFRSSQNVLTREIGRRIWWSVCGLDRVVSICLGRPFAVDDADCSCDLPLDMNDEDLEQDSQQAEPVSNKNTSQLTGFLVFSHLCGIAARIVKSSRRLCNFRRSKAHNKTKRIQRQIEAFESDLETWLQQLPDEIRFSANHVDAYEGVNLTMTTITFILHSASTINLQGPLIGHGKADGTVDRLGERAEYLCIQAARSCIQTAELIHSHVPPSHYLAFCVYQLALSGIVLLRTCAVRPPPEDIVAEVEICIQRLSLLETVWSGARRSRTILQELLLVSRQGPQEADLAGFLDDGKGMLGSEFFLNYDFE